MGGGRGTRRRRWDHDAPKGSNPCGTLAFPGRALAVPALICIHNTTDARSPQVLSPFRNGSQGFRSTGGALILFYPRKRRLGQTTNAAERSGSRSRLGSGSGSGSGSRSRSVEARLVHRRERYVSGSITHMPAVPGAWLDTTWSGNVVRFAQCEANDQQPKCLLHRYESTRVEGSPDHSERKEGKGREKQVARGASDRMVLLYAPMAR